MLVLILVGCGGPQSQWLKRPGMTGHENVLIEMEGETVVETVLVEKEMEYPAAEEQDEVAMPQPTSVGQIAQEPMPTPAPTMTAPEEGASVSTTAA